MKRVCSFLAAFTLAVMLGGHAAAVWAQEAAGTGAGAEPELENLMEGFEEPAPSGDDEFLQGFEEEGPEGAAQTGPAEAKAHSWQLEGEVAFTGIYNFAHDARPPWKGTSMLRPELDLALKYKFSSRWQGRISGRGFYDAVYALRGRDDYSPAVLDAYEQEAELRDTYIQGSLSDDLDLKAGRQVVVWGTLDNLRVTDVLNPLDLRVPGLTDIEDLRLPVTMLKLDYYFGHWNLSGVVMPEVRVSKRPVFGSDFYPAGVPALPEEEPDDGFQNAPYGVSLKGVFSGLDVGFYFADVYADQFYLAPLSGGLPGQFVRRYPRVKMLGTAANLAAGNWLVKGEAAWFDGLRYSNTPQSDYTRLDLGGGVEYSGFKDTSISLEAVNRHLCEYDSRLMQSPDETRRDAFQWSLRMTRDLMNETLTLTLMAVTFGVQAEGGAFERLEAEYDISDALSIKGGAVLFQSGDLGMFRDVADNDRIFMVLKHAF